MTKHIHGLSLLLLMIMIALALLVTLSLVTANSDLKIAQRQADFMSGTQNNINEAQRWVGDIASGKAEFRSGAEVVGGLLIEGPADEDGASEGNIAEKLFDDGSGRLLKLSLKKTEDGIKIVEWVAYTSWDALDEPLYNPNK